MLKPLAILSLALSPALVGAQTAPPADTSSHNQLFVSVEPQVRLEVLDWGGAGSPIVLLAGNGANAHAFDGFAQKLAKTHRVYGITRRGFGNSSRVTHGFLADSLANDVLAVMDSLDIERPLLIGHSLAGTELSSIGSRHPERVAGLVYLDPAFPAALYDSSQTYVGLLMLDVQRKLLRLADNGIGLTIAERETIVRDLLETSLPVLTRDLRAYMNAIEAAPDKSVVAPPPSPNELQRQIGLGLQKVTRIDAPVLGFFAYPRPYPQSIQTDSARARFDSLAATVIGARVNYFERNIAGARVVRLARADHYVFRSHEAEVLVGIQGFAEVLAAAPSCSSRAEPMRYFVDEQPISCAQASAFPRERIATVDVFRNDRVVAIRTKVAQ